MNNSVNATTGKTPTELLHGASIRLFPTAIDKTTVTIPSVADYLERIENSIAIAKDGHVVAKTRQTTQANRHRREEPDYKIGDLVYLDTKELRLLIKQRGRSAKFYPRYVGPFKIIKITPETSTYKLELPSQYKIHPTFHAKRLKPAFENDPELFPGREPPRPGPALPDDAEIYEIEKILDHRDLRSGRQYLVHWLGYSNSDDE